MAHAQHEHPQQAPAEEWAWSFDSTAFLTANLQDRRFRDFHQVESQKHILEAGGFHPVGLQHPHIISRVGAMTAGYVHDVWRNTHHALAVGADITGYRVPSELQESYGRPVSVHVYGRWGVSLR